MGCCYKELYMYMNVYIYTYVYIYIHMYVDLHWSIGSCNPQTIHSVESNQLLTNTGPETRRISPPRRTWSCKMWKPRRCQGKPRLLSTNHSYSSSNRSNRADPFSRKVALSNTKNHRGSLFLSRTVGFNGRFVRFLDAGACASWNWFFFCAGLPHTRQVLGRPEDDTAGLGAEPGFKMIVVGHAWRVMRFGVSQSPDLGRCWDPNLLPVSEQHGGGWGAVERPWLLNLKLRMLERDHFHQLFQMALWNDWPLLRYMYPYRYRYRYRCA